MLKKKMKPFPHFATFISTYSELVETYPSDGNFQKFIKCLQYHIEKEGINSGFVGVVFRFLKTIF